MFSRCFILFSSILLTLLYCSLALAGPGYPVPKTGQTTSYETGDDGDLQLGTTWPDPRFTDNTDGTIRDNLTGLIWLKNANCFGAVEWDQAKTNANLLAHGSCELSDGSSSGDWRLPTIRELESLTDKGQHTPALPSGHPFLYVQTNYYWSSTALVDSSGNFWTVNFNKASLYYITDEDTYYVWPVKNGQ